MSWELLAAALFAVALMVVPHLSVRQPNYIEPIYLFSAMYCYLYFGKAALRIARGDYFQYGRDQLLFALVLAAGGLICFYVGYYSGVGRSLVGLLPVMNSPVQGARVRRCAWLFIALGSAALYFYMRASGGWRLFWSQPHGYGGVAGFPSYISQMSELMLVGFFMMFVDSLSRRNSWLSWRVLMAAVPGVLVYSILWSRRTNIIWVSIVTYVVFHLQRSKRPTAGSFASMLGLVVCAVLLALALRPYLRLGATAEDFQSIVLVKSTDNLSKTGDEFDSYLAAVSLYPDWIGYDHFALLRGIPLHAIPRALWPNKPPLFTPSWDLFLMHSGISSGASEGILGDLYMQWGASAVMAGMFVSGILWRSFFEYLNRSPHAPFMQLFYAVALGNFASFIAQGSVAAVTKWLPFMLPGVAVGYLFSRVRNREFRSTLEPYARRFEMQKRVFRSA